MRRYRRGKRERHLDKLVSDWRDRRVQANKTEQAGHSVESVFGHSGDIIIHTSQMVSVYEATEGNQAYDTWVRKGRQGKLPLPRMKKLGEGKLSVRHSKDTFADPVNAHHALPEFTPKTVLWGTRSARVTHSSAKHGRAGDGLSSRDKIRNAPLDAFLSPHAGILEPGDTKPHGYGLPPVGSPKQRYEGKNSKPKVYPRFSKT